MRKLFVVLPVFILAFLYLKDHYREEYRHVSSNRLLLFGLTILLLFAWVIFDVLRRKQSNFFQIITQSSFYVYVFMVLTLTGYFILFKEISSHDWWHKLASRVERRDHVNLKLFEVFKIYKVTDLQVVGNFIMLLPIGIYFPLLYGKLRRFFPVLLAAFAVSLTIELLQLATKYRSADVDDLLLNTAGAVVGFMIYKIVIGASRNRHKSKI